MKSGSTRGLGGTMARIPYALRTIKWAGVQGLTLLLCFGSGVLLDHVQHLGPSIVVLTTVLGMSLGRTQRSGGVRERLFTLAMLPLTAIACTEVGRLFVEHPNVADALFTAALGGSIWMRRLGHWGARLGTLIALPFIALLVTPVPVLPGAAPGVGRSMLWSAVAAVIAFCWVWAVQEAARRVGFLASPTLPRQRAEASATRRTESSPTRGTAPGRRISASSRLALQMTLSLALAFVIGREAFGPHWTWIVLTAFIVNSGNRGRGDVVYKAALRVCGAAVGTVVATLVGSLFPPRDNTAIVVILIVLVLGGWLRTFNYAYWAGSVTSVLSLLQGYFGEGHPGLIGERLLQIALGGVLAAAIAWLVLPIKSEAVVRRRVADCLEALTEILRAFLHDPAALDRHHRAFTDQLLQLELIAPATAAHRRIHRLRGIEFAHPADALDALAGCAEPVRLIAHAAIQDPDILGDPQVAGLVKAVVGNVVGARRFVGRREQARYRPVPPSIPEQQTSAAREALSALHRIDGSARVVCEVYRPRVPPA